jgi:uncharacterized protein YggT (Ycf19 family)
MNFLLSLIKVLLNFISCFFLLDYKTLLQQSVQFPENKYFFSLLDNLIDPYFLNIVRQVYYFDSKNKQPEKVMPLIAKV